MKLFWKTYAILFFFLSLTNIYLLLDSSWINHQYYQLMIQFNPSTTFIYWANIANLLITAFSSIIVIAYAFNKQHALLAAPIIFFTRIFFEIIGNNYNVLTVKASFHVSAVFGIATICQLFILPLAASYFAHWTYINKK